MIDGFRYSKCQNQDNEKVNRVLNASTYHEYNNLACRVFAECKAGTYAFVKKESKSCFTIFETLPPSCNEGVYFKFKFTT